LFNTSGWRRATTFVLAIAALVVGSAHASSAEVPYDPTRTLVQLGTFPVDGAGNVDVDVTLPEGTTPGFEVIVTGKGPDDQPRSVLGTVSDQTAAQNASAPMVLETAAGPVEVVLASAAAPRQAVDRTVRVQATGFKPNSEVQLSVRFTAAVPAVGATSSGGSNSSALPFTGSDIGSALAVAGAAVLIGSTLVTGARRRRAGAS
jgi:LPXTG-motif cell wall-anchored protein